MGVVGIFAGNISERRVFGLGGNLGNSAGVAGAERRRWLGDTGAGDAIL